jgi:hypothetical protein
VFPRGFANVTVMWMQSFRVRSNSSSLVDTRPVHRNVGGGAQGLPLILATLMAIAALMFGCSRAQSSGQSKPQVLAQSSVMRTVTVTFDYDFSRFPACSTKITQKCVQQFNVYEVSAKPPIFLFTVPLPPNAKGKMTGIPGSAPKKQSFFTGPHRFGVTAKGPGLNYESDPYLAMTFAEVLPDSAAAPAPSNTSPKK